MSFTRENLTEKTVAVLREICRDKNIPGMSKQRKDVIIDVILSNEKAEIYENTKMVVDNSVKGLEANITSNLTKPDASFGNKTTTTIRVSSGASSGMYPVVGKTVGAVSEFLREVLNVERMSRGLVNGVEVEGDYVLKETDVLEFLKPAGRKG